MKDKISELQLDGFDPKKFKVDIKPLLGKAVSETENKQKQFGFDHEFSVAVSDAFMEIKGDEKLIREILDTIFELFSDFLKERVGAETSFDSKLFDKFIERWVDALEMVIHKLLYKMYAGCGPYYIEKDFYERELTGFTAKLNSYQIADGCNDQISKDAIMPFLLAVSRGTGEIDKILSEMRTNCNFRPPTTDYANGDPTALVNALADIIYRLAIMKQPLATDDFEDDPQIGGIIDFTRAKIH